MSAGPTLEVREDAAAFERAWQAVQTASRDFLRSQVLRMVERLLWCC